MGVFARETFMKGKLFGMAKEIGYHDNNRLALAALRWSLAHDEVTAVAYGTDTQGELLSALRVLKSPGFTDEDRSILNQIKKNSCF
jgi:aryl-alcohol dehydrogenase-like predicted oxidoreductase